MHFRFARIAFHTAAAALLSFSSSGPTLADTWPNRPVRLLVGYPAGSTPDGAARSIAESLSKALGKPVVVENKPGASGIIATGQVAKATDDHTLGVVINGNLTSAKMLFRKLSYDPERDFTYLTLLGTAPLVLVAQSNAPDGKAFLDAARASGEKWSYGSVGIGSVAQLGMELLKSRLPGFSPVHIAYPGNPQVLTAVIGKEIQIALMPPGLALPQIKAGKAKGIGLSSGRSILAPDIAPLSELGVNDFQLEVWCALVGPASLGKAAKERLASTLSAVLQEAGVRQLLFNQGWQAPGTASASALQARVRQETKIMQEIITKAGIQPE